VPKFTTRTKRLALNDYDEALTDYSTETGYVIAPEPELDQTPVHNQEAEQNQPHDDVLTWNGDTARTYQMTTAITDRFHPELMMNLKTLAEVAQAYACNPTMKTCMSCNLQQHRTIELCNYCESSKFKVHKISSCEYCN
jgi:hypothetical protein